MIQRMLCDAPYLLRTDRPGFIVLPHHLCSSNCRCPFGTTTASTETINVDVGSCSKYIQGYGLVNGATAMCAAGTFQTYDVTKDGDGEDCSTCPVGYTTSDVGAIRVANCSSE
jgi:hypothetical protein